MSSSWATRKAVQGIRKPDDSVVGRHRAGKPQVDSRVDVHVTVPLDVGSRNYKHLDGVTLWR